MVYKKGASAAPGDRVMVTALEFKGDRILIDLNGGPYVKHRFLRHIQIGVGDVQTQDPNLDEKPTGCRITLVFEGGIPEISAPEVKALLEPVDRFRRQDRRAGLCRHAAAPVKSAIASHEVLVGMNHRMVLAALGQPEIEDSRRPRQTNRYEEWIYGHQPQTMQFVRFNGRPGQPGKDRRAGQAHRSPRPGRDGRLPAAAPHGQRRRRARRRKASRLRHRCACPSETSTPTENPDTSAMHKVQMPAPHKLPGTDPVAHPPDPAPNAPPASKGPTNITPE